MDDIESLTQDIQKISIKENITQHITNIIFSNDYANKCKSEKKVEKNQESLSFLLKKNGIILSQSQCIKFGILLEHIISDFIQKFSKKFINIKPKNTKHSKEKDHLWLNSHDKIIVYAEFKSNIELDTEKSKSTIQKCLQIQNELQILYPNHTIIMNLVALRYFQTSHISNVKKKYIEIQDNLVGVNQYLELFDIDLQLFTSEDQYISFLSNIAKYAFF